MQEFIRPVVGGMLIGIAASLMLYLNGRIAGVSGITQGIFSGKKSDRRWRLYFVGGLITGGLVLRFFFPAAMPSGVTASTGMVVVAGLLVGFGSVMGNGCTSGHGICGISRLSPRSIVGTVTFMVTGMVTVYIFRHILEKS